MSDSTIFFDLTEQDIVDVVNSVWTLKDREDLKDDCIDYVMCGLESNGEDRYAVADRTIKDIIIKFLSSHCGHAMSTKDLLNMWEEQTRLKRVMKNTCVCGVVNCPEEYQHTTSGY